MMTCLAWWRQKKLVDQACHNFMKLANPKNPATTSATPGATIASQLRRRRSSGAPLARFDPLPLAANSADFEFHTVVALGHKLPLTLNFFGSIRR